MYERLLVLRFMIFVLLRLELVSARRLQFLQMERPAQRRRSVLRLAVDFPLNRIATKRSEMKSVLWICRFDCCVALLCLRLGICMGLGVHVYATNVRRKCGNIYLELLYTYVYIFSF